MTNELTVLLSHKKHLSKLWVLLSHNNQLTTLPDEIIEVIGDSILHLSS